MSDNTSGWEIRYTQSARRHRIGRASARHVLATTDPTPVTTSGGADAWRVIGRRPGLIAEVEEIAARFRLSDVLDVRTASLPYGRQRLLELAVAFAARPRANSPIPCFSKHDVTTPSSAACRAA